MPKMTKEQRAQYYAENREKLLAYQREYCAKNREKINAQRREYYAKNREKINECTKRYLKRVRDADPIGYRVKQAVSLLTRLGYTVIPPQEVQTDV